MFYLKYVISYNLKQLSVHYVNNMNRQVNKSHMCTVLALRLESRYSHLKSITKPLEMDVIVTLTFHFISFRSCAWHHHLSRVDCTPLYANSRARQKNQQNPSQMHMYIHIENHFKLHKWFVQRRKKSAKHQRQNQKRRYIYHSFIL